MLCPRGRGTKDVAPHTHTSIKLLGLGGGGGGRAKDVAPTAKSIGVFPRSPFSPRLSTT